MIALLETLKFFGFLAMFVAGIVLAIKAIRTRQQNGKALNVGVRGLCVILGLAISAGTIWPMVQALRVFGNHMAIRQEEEQRHRLEDAYYSAHTMLWNAMEAIGEQRYEDALRMANESIRLGQGITLKRDYEEPKKFELGLAHGIAGQSLYYLDRYEEAKTRLEQAIQADPEEPMAVLTLAWFLSTCPEERFRDGQRALELVETDYEARWSSWQNEVVRAAVYAELGRYEEAVIEMDDEFVLNFGDFEKPFLIEQLDSYKRNEPYRKRRGDRAFIIHTSKFPEWLQ